MAGQHVEHSLQSATLADLLERILDKGIVIAGDIRIKLVEVELLTIQLRLVVCSVEKAKELGLDWWSNDSTLNLRSRPDEAIEERLARLEAQVSNPVPLRREPQSRSLTGKD
ncbi:MAG TPA: gas vesicle protein [Candidatus Binataceae bacterium]